MRSARPTVLVVESDPVALSAIVTMLETAGYDALTAHAFDDATRLLRERSPDVLLAQLRLGLYNGLHLVLKGRATNPDLTAIVMTHHPDAVLKAEADNLDAFYMELPVDQEQLTGVLDGLLGTPARKARSRARAM